MNDKKHATELHAEHKTWVNKLIFYHDDIKIMRHRLEEISTRYTDKEVLAMVEHYQNQFILQLENMDSLKHDINEHESFIMRDLKENPVAGDHRLFTDHPVLREKVDAFEKTMNELRQEYIRFLSRYM